MNIKRVSYVPKQGGLNHGLMHLRIVLGGTEDFPLIDLMSVFRKACFEMKILSAVVNMEGLPDEISPKEGNDIISLINLMKDSGLHVGAEVSGMRYTALAREAGYLIVKIKEPKWLGFKCDELVYEPKELDATEPEILPINAGCVKGLYVTNKRFPVFEMLMKAKYVWNVASAPIVLHEVNLLE